MRCVCAVGLVLLGYSVVIGNALDFRENNRFRVEFVWEDQATCSSVLAAWQDVLAGKSTAAELQQRLEVHEQFGVTAGTMRTMAP